MPIALTYLDVDGGYDYDLDTLDDVQAGPTREQVRHLCIKTVSAVPFIVRWYARSTVGPSNSTACRYAPT